ncbi:MAG: hypothetical protein IJP03_00580 [Christensenellaceae bacterium]|nr:hypothetical protein [Christensenellaceae bacterium]
MMTRQQRAKQFMPFDAMKGLQEALRDREERHTRVARKEISGEDKEAVCAVLARLQKGDEVKLEYYRRFHHAAAAGRVTGISYAGRFLQLEGERICFEDIYTIDKTW